MGTVRTLLLMAATMGPLVSFGQMAEMVAYVPSTPPERTADDLRISFLEPAVPGELEVALPNGTHRVDLLNARGRVKHSHDVNAAGRLDLKKLRRGLWTLRAHTPDGMVVRRFVVQDHGRVLWEMPRTERRNRR